MRTKVMNISQPVYNPEEGAFEAILRLFDAGQVHTYPVRLHAAPHAAFDHVAPGLKARALHDHHIAQIRDRSLHRAALHSRTGLAPAVNARQTRTELGRIGAQIAA